MAMHNTEMLRMRSRRLIAAANEMLGTARDLERLAANDLGEGDDKPEQSAAGNVADQPYYLDLARRAYSNRRRRDTIFRSRMFGEPAWDILLDLFIAAKVGKRVSVTSACIGSAVPNTTALRWITVLEAQGYLVRENDTADARRAFLRLTAETYQRMLTYFAAESAEQGVSLGDAC